MDDARERAYKVLIGLSLTAGIVASVLLTISLPILSQIIQDSNIKMLTESLDCEEDTRLFLSLISELPSNRTLHKREENDCPYVFLLCLTYISSCQYPPGLPGLPGRDGLKGAPGADGAQGQPARLPCEPTLDMRRICSDPCPTGIQGPPGIVGVQGDRGPVGNPGRAGIRGLDGILGKKGEPGPQGIPGLDGEVGDPGEDASPQPFIPGPPGEEGEEGDQGPAGPPGMPGINGPQGPIGPRGKKGHHGYPGEKGAAGLEGPMGDQGLEGNKGVCPTYCATIAAIIAQLRE